MIRSIETTGKTKELAIRAALEESHSWDASTVKTLLRRLRKLPGVKKVFIHNSRNS